MLETERTGLSSPLCLGKTKRINIHNELGEKMTEHLTSCVRYPLLNLLSDPLPEEVAAPSPRVPEWLQ